MNISEIKHEEFVSSLFSSYRHSPDQPILQKVKAAPHEERRLWLHRTGLKSAYFSAPILIP